MDDDRKGSRWALLIVLGIAGLVSTGIYVYFAERSRIIPPRGIANLESFGNEMPPPKRLVVLDFGGSNRFVWVGEKSKWLVSSGPPCYIFDSSGRMIDWDWETGGGQSTSALAQAAMEAKAISIDEAKAIVAETYRSINGE